MILRFLDQLTNVAWVSMTVSSLAGYVVISKMLKGEPSRDSITDSLFKSGLLILLIWKLSPLLLQPTLLLDDTMNLFTFLLSTGTELGLYLGVLAGLSYMYVKMRKGMVPPEKLGEVLPFGLLIGFALYYLLYRNLGTVTSMPWGVAIGQSSSAYHPVGIYQLLFAVGMGGFMMLQRRKGNRFSFRSFLMWFSLFQFGLTFVQFTTPFVFGLSLQQIFFLAIASILILFSKKHQERKDPL